MSDPTNVPPGWYQDPSAPGRPRWWDGTAWTEHYAEPQYQAGTGYPGSYGTVPEGVRTATLWIWLMIAVVAIVTVVNVALALSSLGAVLPAILAAPTNRYAAVALYTQPGYLASLPLALLVYAFSVVASWLDRRRLVAIGVDRPFAWPWTFLNQWVYVIGRTVVLHGRGARDALPPLIVWIVAQVVVFIIVIAMYAAVLGQVVAVVPYGR